MLPLKASLFEEFLSYQYVLLAKYCKYSVKFNLNEHLIYTGYSLVLTVQVEGRTIRTLSFSFHNTHFCNSHTPPP